MNVLHVNNTDLMGRRFNGYDLIQELSSRGVTGKQAVLNKRSKSPDVVPLLVTPEDWALHHASIVVEQRRCMNDVIFPWGAVLTETAEFRHADLLHLHLIHNQVVSLIDLPRVVGLKPCVWTFHDAWALTGHCINPYECERWLHGCEHCPHLDAVFPMDRDCADRMWRVKHRALADLDVDIVVASEYMRDMVSRSPITAHFERVHVIPFGIDVSAFVSQTGKAASRRMLGIPEDDFVVLFRSFPGGIKGLPHIIKAFRMRKPTRPTTLLTVDNRDLLKDLLPEYNIVEMGWVEDQEIYTRIFSACDVFMMPSTAEGFGLMALEAMASERPVVCFEGTSVASVVHAPDCGIAVPMGDAVALRSAVDRLAEDPSEAKRRGRLGRTLAEVHYSHDRYLDAMASLYHGVLERSR